MNTFIYCPNVLCHHGIKGQKWGIRRFQNDDGSLTDVGKKRYYTNEGSLTRRGQKALNKETKILRKLESKLDAKAQRDKINKINKRASMARDVSYIATGASLLGGTGYLVGKIARVTATGFYAYSKLRAEALRKNLSDAAKAEFTVKAQAQAQRIINAFGQEALVKKK